LEAIICLQKASANIDNASKIAVGWSSRATRINAEFGSDHDRIHYYNVLGAVSLSEAESRSVLDERALVCGRHIFGWYFPFRVAQLRDARERGGKLGAIVDGTAPPDLTVTGLAKALPYSWAEQERRIGLSL
jgi:hypothetical protein